MFCYSAFVLPEALTPRRRRELMAANEATQDYHSGNNTPTHDDSDEDGEDEDGDEEDQEDSWWQKFLKRLNFFKKLAILMPHRNEGSKGYDYRLFVLSIAFTLYRIGGLYTNDVSRD